MATSVVDESVEPKPDALSSVYAEKIENINNIRGTLEGLLADLDQHDENLTSGFAEIQSLIDEQREKFKNLSIEFDDAQQRHQERVESSNPEPEDPVEEESGNMDVSLFPALEIKLDPIEPLKPLSELELPPKRDPIEIKPFERRQVDWDRLTLRLDADKKEEDEPVVFPPTVVTVDETDHEKTGTMIFKEHGDDDEKNNELQPTFLFADIFSDPSDDEHTADESDGDGMSEVMISLLETERIAPLMKMDIPKEVEEVVDRKKIKIPKKKKEKREMERDLMKIEYALRECDEFERKYNKLAVLKYRNLLRDTYKRYCIIGGDRNWLNEKGCVAMFHDAYIADKNIEGCTDNDVRALFSEIYYAHHPSSARESHALASPKAIERLETTTLLLSDWNDADPWSGTWEEDTTDEAANEYKLKQLGDTKLIGFIKNFDYGDIHGSINPGRQTRANFVVSWHEGARAGKRRKCRATLIKPKSVLQKTTMSVEWNTIVDNMAYTHGTEERGKYTMKKTDMLDEKDLAKFKAIGLARHEFLDAMITLSGMRYPELKDPQYALFSRLCEEFVVPFIWDGLEKRDAAKIKSIFRPHSTELHKLFHDHSVQSQMSRRQFKELCQDLLASGDFKKGGKPTEEDIVGAFELSKEGYDRTLGYKGFESALENLAHEMYRNAPKPKYATKRLEDKLKMLVKWCVKLQKAERLGKRPTTPRKK